MSSELTTSPRGGFDLVDSRALALTQAMRGFQERLSRHLTDRLAAAGFPEATPARLSFLGALDCGPNHAAELARDLGVTRQAVHKVVKELTALGWLETGPDPAFGNQRVIRFTVEGERMMAEARRLFAELDDALIARYGPSTLDALSDLLEGDLALAGAE